MADFTPLVVMVKDLHPELVAWFIQVHVIRVWRVDLCTQAYRGVSVEMGSKIQASVFQELLRLKGVTTEEGGYYEISFALVVRNEGKDRPTNHPFRLIIQRNSDIVRRKRRLSTSLGLTPLTTIDISLKMHDRDSVVDNIGLLASLSCERHFVKDRRDVVVAFLELVDQSGKIECVLYDEYVESICQYLSEHGSLPPVVVIQFGRIIPVGELLFGKHIMFMNTGATMEGKIQYMTIEVPDMILCEEFLNSHPRVDVSQLKEPNEPGLYVVWGTIVGMLENGSWWYSSCKDGFGRCQSSSVSSSAGHKFMVQRYTLTVKVCDGKSSSFLVLGDERVEALIRIPCRTLLATLEDRNPVVYPSIFSQLIGKNMLFIVEKDNNPKPSFLEVKDICSDRQVMRMFLKPTEAILCGGMVQLSTVLPSLHQLHRVIWAISYAGLDWSFAITYPTGISHAAEKKKACKLQPRHTWDISKKVNRQE
ncbi:Nucleic acid-binding, OB-fold [Sesbania bispinosa]|nr:Nucleic acid-binding, OB-fold [Sesbania bispinosa]